MTELFYRLLNLDYTMTAIERLKEANEVAYLINQIKEQLEKANKVQNLLENTLKEDLTITINIVVTGKGVTEMCSFQVDTDENEELPLLKGMIEDFQVSLYLAHTKLEKILGNGDM